MIGGTRLLPSRAAVETARERRAATRRRSRLARSARDALDLLRARRPDRPGKAVGICPAVVRLARLVREPVDADDDGVAGVDGLLRAVRGVLDLALDEARSRSPPACRPRASIRVEERLGARARSSSVSVSIAYEPPTGSTVFGDAGFGGDDLLRPQRDPRRLLGRQRQRLVAAVAVQRLRAAEHRRQRLQRDADDVVVRLLRGQRAAGGLRVEAQLLRARVGGAEPVAHDARPQPPRGAELRDLLEEVVVRVEEERQPLAELVDVEAGVERRLHVGDARWRT